MAATKIGRSAEKSQSLVVVDQAAEDPWLTVDQLCTELQIARSTFYDWRAKGRAPKCHKLPNGDIRIRRADYERWLADLMDAA
jgi:predicted DNA-binding transcriptional regulator AlpA